MSGSVLPYPLVSVMLLIEESNLTFFCIETETRMNEETSASSYVKERLFHSEHSFLRGKRGLFIWRLSKFCTSVMIVRAGLGQK